MKYHITSSKTKTPAKLARTPRRRGARFKGVMNIRIYLLLSCIFLISGCVPIIEEAEYAAFDNTHGIKVTEVGHSDEVRFASDRPIRYEIDTDLFTINIYTGKNGRFAEFETVDNQGQKLQIKLVNLTKEETERACIFIVPDSRNNAIQYLKLQRWNQGCDSFDKVVSSIEVQVTKGEQVLGNQILLFEIKKDGYYIWYDAV